MKKPEAQETKAKRGAPFRGLKRRERYNITLNPDVVKDAKEYAQAANISFSEMVEQGLKAQMGD